MSTSSSWSILARQRHQLWGTWQSWYPIYVYLTPPTSLGHVHRMEDGCIPKDLLYGELATGYRDIGCPQLHYKDVCKREMMALQLENTNWESLADNRSAAMFGMCLSFLFLFRLRCLVCVCHFCFSWEMSTFSRHWKIVVEISGIIKRYFFLKAMFWVPTDKRTANQLNSFSMELYWG